VRRMTRDATFDLDGRVFVNEGARLVRVAIEADRVLGGTGPLQPRSLCTKAAVRVVAIGALHKAFLYAVVVRPRELRADVLMTGEAQLRLIRHQQALGLLGVVRLVAIDAAYLAQGMLAAGDVLVLQIVIMTAQAAVADRRGRDVFEGENLGRIAAALNVRLAWPVTGFAPLERHAPAGVAHGLPVWRGLVVLVDLLMARLAGFGPDISRGIHRLVRHRLRRLLRLRSGGQAGGRKMRNSDETQGGDAQSQLFTIRHGGPPARTPSFETGRSLNRGDYQKLPQHRAQPDVFNRVVF